MAEMIVPADCYFMMGDHRSISSDSRDFGPVDRSLIYGKASSSTGPLAMSASSTKPGNLPKKALEFTARGKRRKSRRAKPAKID